MWTVRIMRAHEGDAFDFGQETPVRPCGRMPHRHDTMRTAPPAPGGHTIFVAALWRGTGDAPACRGSACHAPRCAASMRSPRDWPTSTAARWLRTGAACCAPTGNDEGRRIGHGIGRGVDPVSQCNRGWSQRRMPTNPRGGCTGGWMTGLHVVSPWRGPCRVAGLARRRLAPATLSTRLPARWSN